MKQFSKSIENSAASLKMEGYTITDDIKDLCERLRTKEITMDEYINIVLSKHGVHLS